MAASLGATIGALRSTSMFFSDVALGLSASMQDNCRFRLRHSPTLLIANIPFVNRVNSLREIPSNVTLASVLRVLSSAKSAAFQDSNDANYVDVSTPGIECSWAWQRHSCGSRTGKESRTLRGMVAVVAGRVTVVALLGCACRKPGMAATVNRWRVGPRG
jgi:hypothetical protein